jgi:hypothetical protein
MIHLIRLSNRLRQKPPVKADINNIRLEKALPFDQKRALPSCIGGSRAASPEHCAGARDHLELLDRHTSPIKELEVMA